MSKTLHNKSLGYRMFEGMLDSSILLRATQTPAQQALQQTAPNENGEMRQTISFSKPVLKKGKRWYIECRVNLPAGASERIRYYGGINRGRNTEEKLRLAENILRNFRPADHVTFQNKKNVPPGRPLLLERDGVRRHLPRKRHCPKFGIVFAMQIETKKQMTYQQIRKALDENPIDSSKYMDAWDDARTMAYDCTFGNIGKSINPQAVPDLLNAARGSISSPARLAT